MLAPQVMLALAYLHESDIVFGIPTIGEAIG